MVDSGGKRMKEFLSGTILLAVAIVVPIQTMAQVDINFSIGLPPPVVFSAPPEVVVVPDTNDVYVVPDIDMDLFFWNGWWWWLWEGHWYRSHYHDRGWGYYDRVPRFYYDVDPEWRGYYGGHNWRGHRWNYERIPSQRLHQNWRSWHDTGYWQRQRTWGVQGYQPRPPQQRQELRYQRQGQYQQRPDVQRYQQQRQEQYQQRPQVQQPQRQEQRPQPPQQQHQPQVQQPHRKPQERSEGGEHQR